MRPIPVFRIFVRESSKIIDGNIPSDIRESYKAAGIIPVSRKGSERYILLGLQKHKKKYFWSAFGGKIIGKEQIEETAIREFKEECGDIFTNKQYDEWLQQILRPTERCPCIWNEPSKFLYFPLEVPFIEETRMSKIPNYEEEKILVKWFKINEMLKYVDSMRGKTIYEAEKANEGYQVGNSGDLLILSPFFLSILRIAGSIQTINYPLSRQANISPIKKVIKNFQLSNLWILFIYFILKLQIKTVFMGWVLIKSVFVNRC